MESNKKKIIDNLLGLEKHIESIHEKNGETQLTGSATYEDICRIRNIIDQLEREEITPDQLLEV